MTRKPPLPILSTLDASAVARLRARLGAQTNEETMRVLGISWATWVKVREGRPVRASTAQRLLARLSGLEREAAE